ncbi:hypothetical protein BCV71DRAFT_183703, partial [Rhizopus microsporus]
FEYRIFRDRNIKAALEEKSNAAVALGRNEDKSLEAVDRRPRKVTGSKVDILFKICKKELSLCEVGLNDVTIADNKYLEEGIMKLLKTLRDMFSALYEANPMKINDLGKISLISLFYYHYSLNCC